MNKEFLKMQKIAGLVTESQYKKLVETEGVANINPAIKNNPDFQELVSLLKQNPKDAQELAKKEDEIADAIENENINEVAFRKDGKYYVEDTYGTTKEVSFKEYLKSKGVSIALSTGAMILLGSVMAGALGTNTPNEILDAILVASGIGAAAGAAFGESKKIKKLSEMQGEEYDDDTIDPNDYADDPYVSDKATYVADALNHVWNMGRGNNRINFEDMAKSIIDDLETRY